MRTYFVPSGRMQDYPHPHPERTAIRQLKLFSDVECRVWSNRAAMLQMLKKQERGEPRYDRWSALVKTTNPPRPLT